MLLQRTRSGKMARRRVFKTRAECPCIKTDLGIISNKNAIIGRTVTLEKAAVSSEVIVRLDGAIVGQLDAPVGNQVASAIERGVTFTAAIENAFASYDDKL